MEVDRRLSPDGFGMLSGEDAKSRAGFRREKLGERINRVHSVCSVHVLYLQTVGIENSY